MIIKSPRAPSFFMPHKRKSSRKGKQNMNPLQYLLRKNVEYRSGISRSITNVEKVYQFILPAPLFSSSLSAGTLATATTLDPVTRLDGFSTRWAAVFRQYCVTKIVICLSITNSAATPVGMVWAQVNESNSAPTGAAVAEEKSVLYLVPYQDESKNSATITWTPHSNEDLSWTDCGTSLSVAYLKLYANTSNTLTSGSDSTTRISAQCYYHIAFRYLF